jgi:hypothetical protein
MTCFTSLGVKPTRSGEGGGVSVTPVTYPSALTPVRTPVTSRTPARAVSRRTSTKQSVVAQTVSNAARCVCVTENSAGKTDKQHGNGFQKYSVSYVLIGTCIALQLVKIIQ